MKISVLMSLYKKEKPDYFTRALQSVWDDQIRKPDEIILVEDGPVGEELEQIVEASKDKLGPVLIIVKLEKNQGLAIALNEGIKHCTGDYIARMDTDDISLPDRFHVQEVFMNDHPEIVLLGGGMVEFNDIEGELNPRMMPATTKDVKESICKSAPFCHPSVIFRKTLFEKGMLYNPKCRRAQDWDLWFRIIAAGYEVANLQKVIIKFRKDPFLYEKRKKSANLEFFVTLKGTYKVYGLFTWRYIYPVVHYLFRQLPPSLAQKIYNRFILKYWQNKDYGK